EVVQERHKILEGQIKRCMNPDGSVNYNKLYEYVSGWYSVAEDLQYHNHHSLTVMSDELTQLNNDLKKQAEALRETESRYALASLGAHDGLWDWDINKNKCFYSDRWKEIIGFESRDKFLTLDDWLDRIAPEHKKSVTAALYRHLDGFSERFDVEYQIKCCDGKYMWVLTRGMAARDDNGKALRIAGSQTDISQRKKNEDLLYKAAFHDKLTGLPNRALFTDRVKQTVKSFRRGQRKNAALLFLDLDRFKIVNDSLGHEAGDQLLISVARRLELTIRASDTICRLGGDEFTILLAEVDDEQHIIAMANRIIDEISKPYFIYGQQIYISGSIGIVLIDKYDEPENIMRNADLAMYQAKHKGKARAELFEKNQYDSIYSTLQIETDLRTAIEKKELVPYFQPIVNLKDGRVKDLEALMRWVHPQKGVIPPLQFIPIAEETGLICEISEFLFHTICTQIKQWSKSHGHMWSPCVAINLSVKQIVNHDHINRLITIFKKSGLSPESIKFEVTESIIMEHSKHALNILNILKKNGFKLSLDDFGTGYSSLSYLTSYPFDYLKIDRSFVMDIDKDIKKQKLVKAIIGLAQDLELKTIAEGIERIEELQFVQHFGGDFAQGYYFARPLPALEILDFLNIDGFDLDTSTIRRSGSSKSHKADDTPKENKLKGDIQYESQPQPSMHSAEPHNKAGEHTSEKIH
ncbi:MAG: EAL domain-containing protein, partial [Alphaproteobacteria bacterium]|nr:EAL domain-containing protein [Alphaproteobacteria bacterium]